MSKEDQKHLLIILTLRWIFYVVFLLCYVAKSRIQNFDLGFWFGVVACFMIYDIMDVFKNYITFTDRLFKESKVLGGKE